MCGADIGWMRLSALRFPLYEPGANLKESCCRGGSQDSDAECVARTDWVVCKPRAQARRENEILFVTARSVSDEAIQPS